MGALTWDETLEKNISEFTGVVPVNGSIWTSLLTDLATSLFQWSANGLDFYDCLLIEQFIVQHKNFCLVRPKYRENMAWVTGRLRIMECIPIERGIRNTATKIQIVVDRPPKGLKRNYNANEFVFFDNFTLTQPLLLIRKYSEILARLDSLYDQNINKVGMPIIGLVESDNSKNDLLNLFKRAMNNSLFAFVNKARNKTTELFYEPKTEFILDKINTERTTIMQEFMQQLGVNPVDNIMDSTHYVNVPAVQESSLISKYFSASMNKYRTHFCDKCNGFEPGLNMQYTATVKSYSEEVAKESEGNRK